LQCVAVCRVVSPSSPDWKQLSSPPRVAVCCIVLRCVAVCCSVLQCVAVCCSVLRGVAVCCSVLQCVTVCCSVSHHVTVETRLNEARILLIQQQNRFLKTKQNIDWQLLPVVCTRDLFSTRTCLPPLPISYVYFATHCQSLS